MNCLIDGGKLIDANIAVLKNVKVKNMLFIGCDIDTSEAHRYWADDCIFEKCRFKSKLENKNK